MSEQELLLPDALCILSYQRARRLSRLPLRRGNGAGSGEQAYAPTPKRSVALTCSGSRRRRCATAARTSGDATEQKNVLRSGARVGLPPRGTLADNATSMQRASLFAHRRLSMHAHTRWGDAVARAIVLGTDHSRDDTRFARFVRLLSSIDPKSAT
jgi:hypothetical protein